MRSCRFLAILLSPLYLIEAVATLVGNPEQPSLHMIGIIRERPSSWSFRLGYLGDYVYKQDFHNEFRIAGNEETASTVQFWTQAGMLTFNVRDRLDLYAILGTSRMQIDQDIFTDQQFAWGIGGKLIIIHEGRFRVGIDVKYFQSDQRPLYFLSDHLAYNIVSDFHFDYHEIQAAMGIAYRTKYVSPYIHATYLIAKLEPRPLIALVRLPDRDLIVDVISQSVIGDRRWGMALGATLIDARKASLAVEWRAFNQNGVSITGEVRF